ncbi:von Willebrand factor type A domain-containing protein [Krasilnikovia cinnamomea]|uniref:von Willebrand factor type A domain-containing protein n=1 Tax=Krasilnikovia cinnamomea TaxID=349313 RepID=A0A4Q7ZTE0_9ACTN|nr:substrate-binding domain-containing protein [Krasilnikovia cinnamomea]RZU54508.1 von Willebrand factor type A domain-containing protein [Krasilnikovia cinnamomea]
MNAAPRPARARTWFRGARLYAAVSVLVVLTGVFAATRVGQGASGCAEPRPVLQVAAAPDIAGAVGEVSRRLVRVAGRSGCFSVAVTARSSAEVADAVTRASARPPDVWIPESTVVLRRLGADVVGRPDPARSVATSPLVLAVSPDVAARLGGARPSIDDLVAAAGGDRPVALRLPERGSAATAGAVLSLRGAVARRPDARAALTGVLRTAEPDAAPAALTPAALAKGHAAAPMTEQAAWAARSALVPLYPRRAGFVFDYPFTVLTLDGYRQQVAGLLFDALRGAAGQELVTAAGFRDVRGQAGAPLAGWGAPGPVPASAPDDAALRGVDRMLDTVRRDARLLAVLDVSGSMGRAVEGLPGATRIDLAKQAAERGLALYPDSTEAGLWIFATDLTPTTDYRELVPVAPLAAGSDGTGNRFRLVDALTGVRPVPGGNTGLYDTTLAAVGAVRQGWNPRKVNAVILITDGANDDRHGLSRAALLAALRAGQATGRPVPVITVALGPDSDVRALARISAATGGASYVARDPRDVREVFLDALGQRACRPDCAPAPTR